jgi:hypothetical protein
LLLPLPLLTPLMLFSASPRQFSLPDAAAAISAAPLFSFFFRRRR